jgi:TP901 family phage tail tape measure protein
MADEKIVTSIVANSDFSNLIADVQRVTNSLSRLQQEFAGANRALAGQIDATNAMFSETMRKTGQFSTHFVSLTSDVEKFGRNLDSGRLKLRDYFRAYQEHARTNSGLIRDLAKQQVQLQNAVLQPLGRNAQGLMQYNVHIPRGLDLTKNRAALLKQELQIMNKVIQDGGVQLINWGKNTQWAGRQLTVGLTLPLAAFGKAAADAFKVADQELTRLTKVYGDVAGTSAQELGKIREEVSATAKELASSMGVSFTETIGLAADIAATGKTGNELLSSVSETTRLAVLGEVDRQEAMKATLAIQSAFKSNTQELAETINFLNAVENQTSTTLNDLVEAIPKAGPVIKGLGGSVQDLALYLTAMREGGVNASEGANALKSALASLINPTDVAVAKFKGFGIDLLGIVKNNAGDVTGTLMALQSALDRLDPLSKQQAIEQLFGKFQFSRLNALFENLGRQGSQTLQVLDLMKASAGELEAVAGRELAAVTESASGRYRRAVEGLKAELAGVGDEFLDIGTKLINVLSKIIDFAQKLPDPIKKVLAFGGAFTAIIGPVIMLTGVLANFFGYIIKGLGHFKALFKGAEGFKLLTPELMAARAASEQLGNEFYSDAAAAKTLSLAIEKLNADLLLLQQNASNVAAVGTGAGKVVSTVGGSPILAMGGPRMVDPAHPLLGGESRAAAHLNPRDPRNPSTIFGLTMQPIPVNRAIGKSPQILMENRLPGIEGLTEVGGISTGVVAGEHARYAALMATLGVQSRQEIEQLKKVIGLGGQVSKEFIDTFDDILPITQRLTQNAATQSAAIVADLRAGKLNVEQARAAIIAVNAELERMMGAQVTQYAAGRGRTIDLTKAPLIDQPVVDVQGKPNLRGMYRQGIFADVMSAVGRATRTRTMGGSYSIETTRPIQRNMGGGVFYNNGDQVPGPNINADVVPAMLTPGEFVIRRDVAQSDPEGMRALNNGEAVIVPVQRNIGGVIPLLRALQTRRRSISGLRVAGERSGRQAYSPGGLNFESMSRSARRGGTLLPNLQQQGYLTQDELSSLSGMIGAHGISRGFLRNVGSRTSQGSYPTSQFEDIFNRFTLSGSFTPTGRSRRDASRYVREGRIAQVLPGSVVHISGDLNTKIAAGTATRADFATLQMHQMTNLLDFLSSRGVPSNLARRIAQTAAERLRNSLPSRGINEQVWAKTIEKAEQSAIIQHSNELASYASPFAANRGGMVPGYRRGGRARAYNTGGYANGVQRRILGGAILKMLAPLGIMYGGQQLGSRVGGGAGTAISTASSLLPFMMYPGMFAGMRGPRPTVQQRLGMPTVPQFTKVPTLEEALAGAPLGQMLPGSAPIPARKQSIFSGTRFAGGIANMAEGPNKFVSVAGKALAGITRLNVALGLGATAVIAANKAWSNYKETQRLSAAAFGLTAQSAEKAGLKFTDYNAKVKDAIAAQKLMIDQNMMTYESLQSAGTPFKMTIAEYKKLRKELKETMAEQIKVINATSRPDAARVAVQLKEQLMAAGLSAEEAAKRIYTLFNLSNKAGMAVSVINTDAFKQIVDAQTAAASALQSFNYAKNFENTKDAAAALNTALTAIGTGVDDLVTKSEKAAKKKGQEFNETAARYEAEKRQLDIIASKVKSQEAIGQGVLNQLKKQNPEIEKFVNKQDTAVSIFQKLRLVARGFTGDLANLNAQQTDAVYKLQIATAQAVETVNQKGLLASQYKAYNDLKKQRDALAKAAKGQSVQEQIDAKERLKAIDKEIKKINDKAEARKKALREEAQAEDMALRIQQQQIEYEKAVAAGDFGGAATAQIELRRLQNEQQTILTEQQIEERRLKDVGPLERERERIQAAQDRLADKAALAAESLDSMNKRLDKQKQKIDNVNNAMTALDVALKLNADNLDKFKQSDEFKGLAANLVKAVKEAGITVANTGLPDVVNGQLKEDVGQQALDLLASYGSEIDTIVASKGITVNATGDIIIGGKKISLDSSDPKKTAYGETFGAEKRTITAKTLKDAAKDATTGKKTQTYIPATGGAGFDVFEWNGKSYAVDKTTGVIYNFDPVENKLGPRAKYASGGLLRGPGTGTSDSIIGMYSNGGMVRVSNGEYIVNADTVSKLGVPFFDRINGMKNGGLMLNYSIPKYDDGGSLIQTAAYNPAMGGSVYNVGNVTMQFAEAPSNGRQLFEEFKMAMALEQRKSGTEINMSRRY